MSHCLLCNLASYPRVKQNGVRVVEIVGAQPRICVGLDTIIITLAFATVLCRMALEQRADEASVPKSDITLFGRMGHGNAMAASKVTGQPANNQKRWCIVRYPDRKAYYRTS
jgi:hypothetical protein